MNPNIFCFSTPRTDDPHAVKLAISEEDMEAFDGLPNPGSGHIAVTDLATGLRYTLRRADCGAGCNCAAQAELGGSWSAIAEPPLLE